MDALMSALPAIISGLTLALIGFIAKSMSRSMGEFKSDFRIMKRSQRNQIKSEITRIYHLSVRQGYINEHELSSVLSMFEDYKALGGNSFIPVIVEKMKQMDTKED